MRTRLTRVALVLLLLVVCAPKAHAWTLIDKASCGAATGGFSNLCSINSTGADLLISGYDYFSGTATLTDSKSNTWTCKTLLSTNGYSLRMCYAWYNGGALSVGSGHTISLAGVDYTGATLTAWSGSKTSGDPFDQEATDTLGGSGNTTGTAGPITPTAGANDLFVTSGVGHGSTEFDAATVDSFTLATRIVYNNPNALGAQLWYATGTGATSAVWHFSLTAYNLDLLAFQPGSAPATTPQSRSLLGVGK